MAKMLNMMFVVGMGICTIGSIFNAYAFREHAPTALLFVGLAALFMGQGYLAAVIHSFIGVELIEVTEDECEADCDCDIDEVNTGFVWEDNQSND